MMMMMMILESSVAAWTHLNYSEFRYHVQEKHDKIRLMDEILHQFMLTRLLANPTGAGLWAKRGVCWMAGEHK